MVEKAIHNSSGYDVKAVWQFGVEGWPLICQLYHPLNARCYHLCLYILNMAGAVFFETSKRGEMATTKLHSCIQVFGISPWKKELPSKILPFLKLPNGVFFCQAPGASQDSHSTSFPRFAKLWLAFVGLLDFPQSCGPFSRPGCALFISSLVLVILVASVISLTSAGVSDPYISATTLCYLLGVLAAAWRLRWCGVQDLLWRDNGGLEETRKGGKQDGEDFKRWGKKFRRFAVDG